MAQKLKPKYEDQSGFVDKTLETLYFEAYSATKRILF